MRARGRVAAGARRELNLIDRPDLARLPIAADFRRREGVERVVVSRIDGDQLPLEMGCELSDFDAASWPDAFSSSQSALLSAAVLRSIRRASQAAIWTPLVAERGRPAADRIEHS